MSTPTEREFYAPTGYKVLVAAVLMFFGLASALGAWLWTLGKIPGLFALSFGLLSVVFGVRFFAISRKPVVAVDGPIVRIFGWAGIRRDIDLRMAVDVSTSSGGIVVKQGRAGAAISINAVGKRNFEELVDIFQSCRFATPTDA